MFYGLEPDDDILFNDPYNEDFVNYTNSLTNSFDAFKKNNPTYLEDLNNRIKHLYSIYKLICGKRFSKIAQNQEYNETACRMGFGMLLRHALEVISIDILLRCGIEVGNKTVFERLTKLNGQIISGYDRQKDAVLHQALDLTNEIAHPHLIGSSNSFKTLCDFYQTSFKDVMEQQILQTKRRDVKKYLRVLKKELDNYRIQNKTTYNLISGCLVRHLTECAVNLWCYNYSLVPTDASTFENQINLSGELTVLSQIAKENRNTGFGSSALTVEVVGVLFELKNTSNSMMHVNPESIRIKNIHFLGKESRGLYTKITSECSPYALDIKLNKPVSDTPSLVTTVLCGFLGWFGVHHFYAGNIFKGIVSLLFCGFIIGPFISLNNLRTGNFNTKKWGTLPKTRLTSFLSVVFMLLHIALLYLIIFKR